MREAIAVAERLGERLEVGVVRARYLGEGGDGERFGKGAESVVGDVDGAERETREGSLGEGLDPVVVQLEALEDGEAGDGVGEAAMSLWEATSATSSRASHHEGAAEGASKLMVSGGGRAGAAAAPASPSVNASGGIAPRLRPRRSRTPLERAASSALSIALALIGAIAARFEGARPGEDAR